MSLTTSPKVDFSFEIRSGIFFQNVILKVLYHEIYQHLRGLHNSVNKYFPRDHNTILQSHAQVKKSIHSAR